MKTSLLIVLILLFSWQIFSFDKPKPEHYIGEKFGGGIIFYLDGTGQHGLIAAPYDQSDGIKWGCSHKRINANNINDGAVNTNKIIENCGKDNAAGICADLELSGFDDWYLPCMAELILIWDNRMKIDGLTTNEYVSSSEHHDNANDCWAIYFGRNGKKFHYNKGRKYAVRAVRKF